MNSELKRRIGVKAKIMLRAWDDRAEAIRKADAAKAKYQEAAEHYHSVAALMQDKTIYDEANDRALFEDEQWNIASQRKTEADARMKDIFRDMVNFERKRIMAAPMQAFLDARSRGPAAKAHMYSMIGRMERYIGCKDFVGAMIVLRALDDVLDELEKHTNPPKESA